MGAHPRSNPRVEAMSGAFETSETDASETATLREENQAPRLERFRQCKEN
jgi:hypothetical protein